MLNSSVVGFKNPKKVGRGHGRGRVTIQSRIGLGPATAQSEVDIKKT